MNIETALKAKLGRVGKLQLQDRGGDEPHGSVVFGSLVVARGEPAELFQAIDQTLDAIARAVDIPIKGTRSVLIAAAGDGNPNAMLAQVLADLATAVAFITDRVPRLSLFGR